MTTIEVEVELSEIIDNFDYSEILEAIPFEYICEFVNCKLDTQELIETFDIRALPQVEEMDEPELYVTLQQILKRIVNEG